MTTLEDLKRLVNSKREIPMNSPRKINKTDKFAKSDDTIWNLIEMKRITKPMPVNMAIGGAA